MAYTDFTYYNENMETSGLSATQSGFTWPHSETLTNPLATEGIYGRVWQAKKATTQPSRHTVTPKKDIFVNYASAFDQENVVGDATGPIKAISQRIWVRYDEEDFVGNPVIPTTNIALGLYVANSPLVIDVDSTTSYYNFCLKGTNKIVFCKKEFVTIDEFFPGQTIPGKWWRLRLDVIPLYDSVSEPGTSSFFGHKVASYIAEQSSPETWVKIQEVDLPEIGNLGSFTYSALGPQGTAGFGAKVAKNSVFQGTNFYYDRYQMFLEDVL